MVIDFIQRLLLKACLVGIGSTLLFAFVRATLPTALRQASYAMHCAKGKGLAVLFPVVFALGMLVYGGSKNLSPTNAPPVLQSAPAMARASAGQTRIEKWFRRGAWEDGEHIRFDDDWRFPYGTNHLQSVELWSQGTVFPSAKDPDAIVALPFPLSLAPQETEVFYGRTADNAYRFEWRNAHPNRSANVTTNVAIELRRNGDCAIVTADATTVVPYVIPYPHDGIGQDEDWVRANLSRFQRLIPSATNVEDIFSIGYTNWVNAQIGHDLTNGLYRFTADFSERPLEPTRLTVGDYLVVVTNAGEYSFVLAKGEKYEFDTEPFVEEVEYRMADDIGEDELLLCGVTNDWVPPNVWSTDGGWSSLSPPYDAGRRHYPGACLWLPVLHGSPDFSDNWAQDFPQTFEAVLADYCLPMTPAFEWFASGMEVEFADPHAQTTAAEFRGYESFWTTPSMAVKTEICGYTLWSDVYAHDILPDVPQMGLSIRAPNAVFMNDDGDEDGVRKDYEIAGEHFSDDDIVAVVVTFRSSVPTNGTLWVRPLIREGHLWRDAARSDEVGIEDMVTFEETTEITKEYFLECEYESYRYASNVIQAKWSDGHGGERQTEHRFSAISCVAEPITAETVKVDGAEYIVNPCCAIIGSNTYMRVAVHPDSIPDSAIIWSVISGAAEFPRGNHGRDVVVVARGDEGDALVLEVKVEGCVGRCPRFELMLVDMREVLIYPYLITGAPGAELSQAQLTEKLREVNMIYSQVGLHFAAAPMETIENYDWSNYGLVKREIRRAICDYAHKIDGVEVYFVGANNEVVDYETKALGLASTDGVVIKCYADGRALAHEIGHICHLADIYIDDNCVEQYQPLREEWMPSDWNNGTGMRYYSPDKCQHDLIPDLLMHGTSFGNHLDIPLGFVRGLVEDHSSPVGRVSGNAAVGRSAMIIFPPHTR